MIKLEENTARLLASKEHAETEFKQVEKSMLEERDELLDHSKAQQEKLEENMVILKYDNDCVEKHVRDMNKREESLLKEIDDLLERSTEERAQKEEEILKLNEKIIKLEERVSTSLAMNESGEINAKGER